MTLAVIVLVAAVIFALLFAVWVVLMSRHDARENVRMTAELRRAPPVLGGAPRHRRRPPPP